MSRSSARTRVRTIVHVRFSTMGRSSARVGLQLG
jgi:hypothetical protein